MELFVYARAPLRMKRKPVQVYDLQQAIVTALEIRRVRLSGHGMTTVDGHFDISISTNRRGRAKAIRIARQVFRAFGLNRLQIQVEA